MDPNATLRLINDAKSHFDIKEAVIDLAGWLYHGGFQPDWDAYPLAAKRYERMKHLFWHR